MARALRLPAIALAVFAIHFPFLALPYFWDELGQFVPAALDILRDGAWVPHSAVPNVHPPGVMAYLAAVWRIFGYSIPATRAAMLLLGSLTELFTFLLAVRLLRGSAPAFLAVLLLLLDPLFYTQSMLAQLDMPAMLASTAALWLFLEERLALAALVCTVLVLAKETGILLPLVFLRGTGIRACVAFLAPFFALAAWLFLLWRTTGHIFGDPGFTHYNLTWALNPVRAAGSLARHIYFLFIADFRWIGTAALLATRSQWRRFWTPDWRIALAFGAGHVVLVSVLGGAELERYLLPALPILYIAMAGSLLLLVSRWRRLAIPGLAAGLLAGMFINPPYPFPYENNLAMVDFVELHHTAARFLEGNHANATIYTAWPLTAALRRPEFGYVQRPFPTMETSDFHYSTLSRLDPAKVRVLVLYSRTWDPTWGLLRIGWVRRFLTRYYEYEPQMTAQQVQEELGLNQVARWERRGQWIEIYARQNGSVNLVARTVSPSASVTEPEKRRQQDRSLTVTAR